jgi:hypothetical protein
MAAVAISALALPGCGGDVRRAETTVTVAPSAQPVTHVKLPSGPAVSVRAPSPARRAYLARADRVCARFDPKRNEARRRAAAEAADPAKATRSYDEGIKVGVAQLRALEAIPPPSGDRAALRANVFAPLRAQLALRRRVGTALSHGDAAVLRPLQRRIDDLTRALEGFALGYGFKSCGTD